MPKTSEMKSRPLLGGLSWLPLSTGLLTILTCIVTYTIGVLTKHISPILPYVSDAGMHYPESSIFSLCMDVVVALLTATIVVRYLLLSDSVPKHPERLPQLRFMRVNKSSLVLGCLSAVGLAILSNFPEDKNLTVHLIGASLCFLFGVMYSFMHAWISFQTTELCSPYVCITRLALASFSAADLAMVILFGSGLRWYATAENPVLHYRQISAAFEWMLVVLLNIYFMTFWCEFRLIRITPRLYHWTGQSWESIEGASSIGSATPATESLNDEDLEAIQVKGKLMIKIPEEMEKGYYFTPGADVTPQSHHYDNVSDWASKNALYSSIITSSFSNSVLSELLEQSATSQFDDECRISFSHPICFSDLGNPDVMREGGQHTLQSPVTCKEKSASSVSFWTF
ncbi:DNA damage-regulated autophagy modulator protein 2-like [Diadema antillarum]|uniref:DNA damage-regulated autophagy modulator protein 2-like n=1 Tax=Diadema antillarum TaxID=105358 RepID=UPI003A888894